MKSYPVRQMTVILLCFILAAACIPPITGHTQTSGKTVRVGFYESAYHHTDQFGRIDGYGYEYQQRIATFTGWNYEYVEGSWSELYEKLEAGEIDLLSDVSYTKERAEKILYSAQEMGSEDFHAYITPDNTEISPDDFSTFNGKKVGVNKNSVQEEQFKKWAKSHGVTPQVVELTVKTPEAFDMLARGDIDVLVTLDIYGKAENVLPVCKIGSADSYFGISRKRPDIKKELDVAMNRIMEENRYFNQQLAQKYENSQVINSFLTSDELEWYSGHGTIRVGYRDDYIPFCDEEETTGELTGALKDFLDYARTCEKNAELSFETRAFRTTEEAMQALSTGEIDCMFPASISAYDAEKRGLVITDTFISSEVYAAVRTADHQGVSPDREMTVAIVKGNPNFEAFLMDNFPNWEVARYENSEEGFAAVANHEADCILVSSYRLNRMDDLCEKYKLQSLSTGKTMNMAFAVRREDDCLYSILNKISRLMPDDTLNSSLTYYSTEAGKTSFTDFIKDNMVAVLLFITSVFAVILVLLLMNLHSAKRASEGRQLISATETDSLTGLYNRNFFYEYASRMHREHPDRPMDAIVLNIEEFHSVNELNGRDFGDHVLKTIGEEIRVFLTEKEGIAGRSEGDHFGIYCRHIEDYRLLFRRFQDSVDRIAGKTSIHLRMGVMPWEPDTDPIKQFDQAHTACNLARGNYNRRLVVFDEEVRESEQFEKRLLNDLRRAIDDHEFEVYYQPKYDIQTDRPRLISAEALIRWNHPDLGMIPPEDFILLFEKKGQITEIDKYVWTEAARQIARWREKLGITLPVSVNLSRMDVFEPSLERTLDELLVNNGLEHDILTLEVTESAYTENADQVIRVIKGLRENGYKIEMDDFGSGYSSLNMLSSMPIDVLKMDRAFIMNIEHSEKDVRLVELILDIAKNLKVPVVAEGVETEGQLDLLREMGCELVQGYYFSPPLPAEEFEKKILLESKVRNT